ncbi:hypothetical protein GCM10007966_19430 [Legionella impletisoli]|uniref:Uncharacterized protein n=2 Tax=Legionella impletisoli TaxID=343510 RepID=A0A917JYW4_9GAMM|nr:hypothetical protein GCM10007966_19430 [Legionella impletisoli]
MPTIDELSNKSSKRKFKKSDYRPWNYMDEFEKESNGNQKGTKEKSTDNQLEIKRESRDNYSNGAILETTQTKETKVKGSSETLYDAETALDTIFRLTGHQKKIFLFIVERCMSRGMLTTSVIKGETLVDITNTTIKMVKTSIQRLVGKDLIIREKGKTGRGGFYSFRIIEVVRNAAIEYKRMVSLDNHIEINGESFGTHKEINKKSNDSQNKLYLPDEWEAINILPLEDNGFNRNHLLDIYETGLADPQMVQESILHFSYGLEYEPSKYKQYDDVLNVLIGRLRKGKPWFEKNYRSPQEIAQQKLFENKKLEIERKKKLEEESYSLAQSEWIQNLSKEDIEKVAPKKTNATFTPPQEARLKLYFKENIWPELKSEYLIETE